MGLDNNSHKATSKIVAQRIKCGGERIWRFEDFEGLSSTAVAQALSRLTRRGELERLSKGVYYRAVNTTFGKSKPNPTSIRKLASKKVKSFPSGISAANVLGFSTQNPSKPEIATASLSLPRKLIGQDTILHTRRPAAWENLSETEAALLDLLRKKALLSELSPQATVEKLVSFLSVRGCFEHLVKASATEPPRVRAMLGALGELLNKRQSVLKEIRESLNPLSRYDFGLLSVLPNAKEWQAKGKSRY